MSFIIYYYLLRTVECRVLSETQNSEVSDPGLRDWGVGAGHLLGRILGLDLRRRHHQRPAIRVQGLVFGFWVEGLGFRVGG